jgi:excisionase family DNA binding protein
MNSPLVYSIPEACSLAHTGRTALYKAINSGELPARKRGKRTLILHQDLCCWLQSLPSFAAKTAIQSDVIAPAHGKSSKWDRSGT